MSLRTSAARLGLLAASTVAGVGLAAAPAHAAAPSHGEFCPNAMHGKTALGEGGYTYLCSEDTADTLWRWRRQGTTTTGTSGGTGTAAGTSSGTTSGQGSHTTNTGSGDSRKGNTLPVTGSRAATLGAAGGGLLTAGTGAVLVARRRRRRFTA